MNSLWNPATVEAARHGLYSVVLTVGSVAGWVALASLGQAVGVEQNLGEILALLSFLAVHVLIWKYGVFRQWSRISPHLTQVAGWLFGLCLLWNIALVGFQLLSILFMILGLALALDTSPLSPGYN